MRTRYRGLQSLAASSGVSLMPTEKRVRDFGIACNLTGVSLSNAFLDVLDLPLMHVEIRIDGFVQYVGPVAVVRACNCIQGLPFFRVEAKTDCFPIHKDIIPRISAQYAKLNRQR